MVKDVESDQPVSQFLQLAPLELKQTRSLPILKLSTSCVQRHVSKSDVQGLRGVPEERCGGWRKGVCDVDPAKGKEGSAGCAAQ